MLTLLPAPPKFLPAQHGIEALNGGDDHLRVSVHLIGAEVLDVVEFRELATVIRGTICLELFQRLAAKVVAIHQEQDAVGLGVLDEPIREGTGRERLPRAHDHLDESARVSAFE